ncbi:hypothetical protein CEE44_04585 [Candidatus Woesearchaeota archaeon B3_Woes]|nr:MAG: hypothetical protein CEE44_04585 [Candidatus Woesearchaeota archaeon B3_Woes]
MEEGSHHEGEIVIKITPRNLERLIYILIIIGLVIFSVVKLKVGECPEVEECGAVDTTPTEEVTPPDDTTATTTVTTTTTDDDTTPSLSGEVEFLLTDVKLCVEDEDNDQGMFDSVSIYIKNGYKRTFEGEIQFYLWEGRILDEIEDKSAFIDNIKILSGAPLSTTFTVDSGRFSNKGRFVGIDNSKKVKAVLIDAGTNTEIKEITFPDDLEATVEC